MNVSMLEKKAMENLIASVRLLEACRTIREFIPEEPNHVEEAAPKQLPKAKRPYTRRLKAEVVERPIGTAAVEAGFDPKRNPLIHTILEILGEKGPIGSTAIAQVLRERGHPDPSTGKKTLAGVVGQALFNRMKYQSKFGKGDLRKKKVGGHVMWRIKKYNLTNRGEE